LSSFRGYYSSIMQLSRIRIMKEKYNKARMIFLWLFYNAQCDYDYAIDTLFEPMYNFVDNYIQQFGKIFVGFLSFMIFLMVTIAYLIVVPYEWPKRNFLQICVYFVIGKWLLINLIFNFYMGCRTEPVAVGVCKHCIQPKPPRTHHCSVCNRCILKMDHHCPWLNQCVGHYNHRYFYLTLIFMWLSCIYVVYGMRDCFLDHYRIEGTTVPWCMAMENKLCYAKWLCHFETNISTKCEKEQETCRELVSGKMVQYLILVEFFVALAIVVGLLWLIYSHGKIISNGETSIEYYVNLATAKKFATRQKVYMNPYDFGWRKNWKSFLGIDDFREDFFKKIIIPSVYKPDGDGLSWPFAFSLDELLPHVQGQTSRSCQWLKEKSNLLLLKIN
ncbi:putative palmitoyltransferase ZDHHC16, partial [Trichinella pseudospiralis]